MSYGLHFADRVLRKAGGLPADAIGVLAETLAVVLLDPYDAMHSAPVSRDPRERMATLSDGGFIEFGVDDEAMTVTVTELLWAD